MSPNPCPYGSGKKYKHCCLKKDEADEHRCQNRDMRPWLPLPLPNPRGRSLRKPWPIRTSTTRRRMSSPLLPMQLSTSSVPVSSKKPSRALAICWCASPMSTTAMTESGAILEIPDGT
jgi:hypothetical protein